MYIYIYTYVISIYIFNYKAQVDLVSVYKKNSANYRGNGGVGAIDMDNQGEPSLLITP